MKKELTLRSAIPFVLFLLFCLFSSNLSAQITLDTATVETRTISCSSSTSFTDDNTSSGLYFDEFARKDSVVICPSSAGRQVKVTFTSFDVAGGDVLSVYDGNFLKNSSQLIDNASGTGSSRAFGGWVAANCDPAINPTGCLSFIFDTNGDRAKGNGWQASISCESSGVTVQCPSNITVVDDCNSLDGMVSVTVMKPTFTTCGGSSFAMISLNSSCSSIPSGNVLADGGVYGTYTIPLGSHQITATSLADDSKRCTYFVIGDQPTLACNDNVTSTIGFGCTASVRVDDILENPCIGNGTVYKLSVNLGNKGTLSATVDGSSFSSLNATTLDIPSTNFDCGREYSIEVTRTVSFSGCGNGNSVSKSCTGRVKFVDNSAPSISVTSQTLTTCGSLTDAELKRALTINVSDNCAVKDTIVSIGSFPSNFCRSNLSVPVTVTAVDFCGNSNTKTFNVAIIRPTKFFSPKDTVLTCGSGYDPAIAGYPLLDTDADNIGDLAIIGNTCSFIPLYTDQRVEAGNSKTIKIYRTWQIKDDCNQAVPVTLEPQLIEIKDTGKPAINCPAGNQRGTENNPNSITTGFNNCTATLNIVAPTASDDCGGNVSVDFEYAIDLSDTTRINNVVGIPIGSYYAVYFGRDDTGNRSDTCKVYFNVVDSNAPQAVCVDELNVSFVNNLVTLRVEDIAVNNADNCGKINQQIRKEGGQWGETVSLTCAEINASNKIYLRVIDGSGGENTCWTTITAKDASVPECQSLSDQTIACEDYHNDQFGASTDANNNRSFDESEWQALTGSLESTYNSEFGNPDCSDSQSCGSAFVEQQYQVIQAQCGETKISRRYRSTDNVNNQSAWKTQNITLTFEENFSVTFSADWSGNCGDNFPQPAINLDANGCSVIAWTFSDKRFDGVSDGCYLIERTYSVSNSCYHNAGQAAVQIARVEDEHGVSRGITLTHEDLANVGLFEYIKVLKVSDTEAPVITIAATDECILDATCTAQKTFSMSADDCLGTEALTYSYELLDNGTVVQSGSTSSFTATVSPKTYEVKWTSSDNCGNTASESATYTFKDCKKPSPFCLDGVATTVDNNGKALVWASDINQKSTDNCTAEDKLEIRIYHPVLEGAVARPQNGDGSDVVLALPKNIELTCDQLGSQAVELYVVDAAGNWDFCTGSVFVQDGSGTCGGGGLLDSTNVAMLAGGIVSLNNIPVSGVELTAKGTALYEQKITTDDNGIFEMNLPKGIGYVISFAKEGDPANGMTVFDIIMVSKHILGITSFESPYQLIAADVNKSGSVTAFDLVLMRKIILGIDSEFVGNTPWRFFPAGGELTAQSSGDIASLSETIVINSLENSQDALDYVAVKIGDLNASVKVDGFVSSEDRNKNTVSITTQDKIVKSGASVEITLSQNELTTIQGLQFSLNYEGLTLENINYGQIQKQHIAQTRSNELTIVWDKFSVDKAATTNALLTLTFTANQSGQLSELLSLSTSTQTEGVTNNNEVTNIALNFEKATPTNSFKLFQNTPNPFATSTDIGFELSKKGEIVLEIFNLQGSLLKQIKGTFEAGQHTVTIQKEDLKGNGVLLYQLTTPSGIDSKKMISY